jgi:hypothetical protein
LDKGALWVVEKYAGRTYVGIFLSVKDYQFKMLIAK